ncbi:MAG: membrane dipeptidase, partial [Blastocatellia bacterium]|nr:membrane dipeptidase [Blastocatellia bacterium]
MKLTTVIFCVLLLFVTTTLAQTMPAGADAKLWKRALDLHKRSIVIDGHNDITSPMVDDDYDLLTPTVGRYHLSGSPFHTDMNRLKASGITGEFFSIYVGANYVRE